MKKNGLAKCFAAIAFADRQKHGDAALAIVHAPSKEPSVSWIPYALSVAGIAIAVAALASASFWFEGRGARERVALATHNVVSLLDSQIGGGFEKVDIALQSIAFTYQNSLNGTQSIDELNASLEQHKSILPELDAIGIVDSHGSLRMRRGLANTLPVDVSDRRYFIRARDDPAGGLQIDGPVFSRINQRWVIVFARPLLGRDRVFAGLVYASLSTDYFQRIFERVQLGPHGAATIRTEDLALVHRYPLPPDAKIGDRTVSARLLDMVRAQPERGEYIAPAALDGIKRMNAYQKVSDYPFYVLVGIATDDYLGDMRQNSLVLAVLTLIVILTSIFTARALYRVSLREAEQEQTNVALQRLASTDALTGVANRRSFEDTLQMEWRRAMREAQPISLLMIDVDHFKHYNDTHGHQQGDACLRLIAASMSEQARRSIDMVARYGGEEFAVILPNATAENAATMAERMRASVERLELRHAGLDDYSHVTVSVGAATMIASPQRDFGQLLAAADGALYEAKRKGRNTTTCVHT